MFLVLLVDYFWATADCALLRIEAAGTSFINASDAYGLTRLAAGTGFGLSACLN